MIVIFSDAHDDHAIAVSEKLKNHQERPIILDLGKLPQHMSVEAHYVNTHTDFRFNFSNGESINLNDVKSFWWRRPQPLELDPNIQQQSHREFALNEWHTALHGIWASIDCLWINDILKDQIAGHKPYQLTVAKRVGLNVPETLITNNPSEVLNFLKKHQGKVVYKAFSATPSQWRETRPLEQRFLSYLDTVRYAPVIFQEYVNSASDLRITIVGQELFAAEGNSGGSYQYDWRMSTSSWTKHKLPENIKDLLLKYMKALGLEYGAIDMKLTADGQYYFLEVNTAGQFLFAEYDAKLPISDALARHLAHGNKTY